MNHLELVTRAELFKIYIPHTDPSGKESTRVDHYCYGASRLDAEVITPNEKHEIIKRYLTTASTILKVSSHFIDEKI